MKRKHQFCGKCEAPVMEYKAGKKRSWICSGGCGELMHNPMPRIKFSTAAKKNLSSQMFPVVGDYLNEKFLNKKDRSDDAQPAHHRMTQFEKALALEEAECRHKRRQHGESC